MQPATLHEPRHTHGQLLNQILEEHQHKEGNLLPILHAVQDQLGYIPEDLIAPIAQAINRSSAEIFGVISFYKHFRTQACGDIHIEFCQAEACQARGSKKVEQEVKHLLNAHWPDATVEPVYCLGLCAQGPAAMINQQPLARVTPSRIKAKIEGVVTCKA
ncbi:NAD(P)H-dependent oxidoreductase subunit E [Advenella sp. EE-W14]|uniref:NADH-quinone oxidoreductase subunit NuoE family protein n=1 Tax=Advenella sp. EE-W14 TaxID=2722705 RepID=UPI00145DC50A|nr:NAD(P)H-dependent oxidoreductase subunit E [Advenella sp. EE-W14]